LKSQYYKIITIIWAKIFRCYNSHEVRMCGGHIYNPYIDATAVLAWYVHE